MLRYHQLESATHADQRRRAVSVMELAEPHFAHPRPAMARAHIALGNPAAARMLLAGVLDTQPKQEERADATRLLQTLPR